MHSTMPLDIASLGGSTSSLDTLSWSTDYKLYGSTSRTITSLVLAAVTQFTPSSLPRVLGEAKAYDIATDLALICRLALDLDNTKQPLYDPHSSPLAAFLDPKNIMDSLPRVRIWHHPPDRDYWVTMRKTARRWTTYGKAFLLENHDDILNRNYLLEEELREYPRPTVDWGANLFSWQEPNTMIDKATDLAKTLSKDFSTFISEGVVSDRALMVRLGTLGELLINYHLQKATIDYLCIKASINKRPLGQRLLSGTPKHIGRLASFLYQKAGRPVIRFAHGGERAFYSDNEWAMAELVNCDVYYAHSTGEAHALQQRIRSKKIAVPTHTANIEFRSLGSQRHREIFRHANEEPSHPHSGWVMYVAGGYLGEALADFTSRKPPDILYIDWQISLLKSLRALKYKIITKIHPRGILAEHSLLAPYSDKVVRGFFNPFECQVDCLIFDFAGSAFFDALASHHGIVLADTAVRPFDENTKPHLLDRCNIVTAYHDDRGRFRVSREGLGNAIAHASRHSGCSSTFYKQYIAS